MPVIIKILQIEDAQKRKGIIEAIRAEIDPLPTQYEISILTFAENNFWELVIKPPDGREIYYLLTAKDGDLEPAGFRRKIRELIAAV